MKKTYFGIPIQEKNLLLLDDIKKLPFYKFWEASSAGSALLVDKNGCEMVYLHDWERFSRVFIITGKHRYQTPDEEINRDTHQPNKETIATLEELDSGKGTCFNSIEELFADLNDKNLNEFMNDRNDAPPQERDLGLP